MVKKTLMTKLMAKGNFFDFRSYKGLFRLWIFVNFLVAFAWLYPEIMQRPEKTVYIWHWYAIYLGFFGYTGVFFGFLYLYLERNNPTLLKKFAPSVYKERIQGLENESSITRPGEQKISSEKNE